MLEVGCGNGYVTQQLRERVRHVDGFDYAENMVARARANYGETNNRFFHASVLDPNACEAGTYDAAVCVRVLINLRDAGEQATALGNIARWLKPGGRLILVEGFTDGFDALNELRGKCELPDLVPAAINFYSSIAELMPVIERSFTVAERVPHRHVRFPDPGRLSAPGRAGPGRRLRRFPPQDRHHRAPVQSGRHAAAGPGARLYADQAGGLRGRPRSPTTPRSMPSISGRTGGEARPRLGRSNRRPGAARFLLVCFYDPNGIATVYESIALWQRLSEFDLEILNLWPTRGDWVRLPPTPRSCRI